MDNMITTQQGTVALRPVHEIAQSIRFHAQNAALNIIAIGRDLIEAKQQLDHGAWLPWLKSVGNISSRTAENYMRLAEAADTIPALQSIPYTKALALLDTPEAEREKLLSEGVEDKSAAEIKRLNAELKQAQKESAERETARAQAMKLYTKAEQERQQLIKAQAEAKPETVEVIREVEKIPEDYDQIKQDLAKANETIAQMAEAAEESFGKTLETQYEDESAEQLPVVENLMSYCNEFHAKCNAFEFADEALAGMNAMRLQGYRISIKGISALCERMLATLDRAEGKTVLDMGVVL